MAKVTLRLVEDEAGELITASNQMADMLNTFFCISLHYISNIPKKSDDLM